MTFRSMCVFVLCFAFAPVIGVGATGCAGLTSAQVASIEGGAVTLGCDAAGLVGVASGATEVGAVCASLAPLVRSIVDAVTGTMPADRRAQIASAPTNDARFVPLLKGGIPIGYIRSDIAVAVQADPRLAR